MAATAPYLRQLDERPLPLDAIAEEAADCFLLLLHLAHRCEVSLLDAADRKFAENKLRRWLAPDAEGVVEHARDGGET